MRVAARHIARTERGVDDDDPKRSFALVSSVDASLPAVAAAAPGAVSLSTSLKDLIALGKPNIAFMAAVVAGGTFLLSVPVVDAASLRRGFFGVFGIGLIVMGAGALNMLIERDVDALMTRTQERPLAAGRMAPLTAFVVGGLWCLLSLPLLWFFSPEGSPRGLTLGLALFSLFLYVLVYTPMKRTSPWSLVVGAIPGAMPALMGGTLGAGRVDVAGVALFTVVFVWQLPHFLAISLYREAEYVRAGHKVFPTALGVDTTRWLMTATTLPLCALGVALWPLGLGGPVYALIATGVGVWFCFAVVGGLVIGSKRANVDVWARKVFLGSLVWQTVVFGALAVDRVVLVLAG